MTGFPRFRGAFRPRIVRFQLAVARRVLNAVNIDLTLTTPAHAKGSVPVIMEFGWSREVIEALARRFPQTFAAG